MQTSANIATTSWLLRPSRRLERGNISFPVRAKEMLEVAETSEVLRRLVVDEVGSGWKAEATVDAAGRLVLTVFHELELTEIHLFTWVEDEAEAQQVSAALRNSIMLQREAQFLRELPTVPTPDHRRVIADVLQIARSFGWKRAEIGAVAHLLQQRGLLTEAEGTWLRRAAPDYRWPQGASTG